MHFRDTALASVLALCTLLAACATEMRTEPNKPLPKLAMQNQLLNPSNGGQLIEANHLRPGDIVLTADNGVKSAGIRVLTLSPVSHAAVYVGKQQIIEAVGAGVQARAIEQMLGEESTIVAFRHPNINAEQVQKLTAFLEKHIGQKYNYVGILLQTPFVIERRVCELPLVPSLVRDFCIRGIAAVQLGLGRNDQFFCSQFVLEAFRQAGAPLTSADPRLFTPADILHMREGDVPSVRTLQSLQYVGHLKAPPIEQAVSSAN